jgi:hypothetical protein
MLNAGVCSAFSGIFLRYQSRIEGVLVFGVLLLVMVGFDEWEVRRRNL